jgi:putative transcription factor
MQSYKGKQEATSQKNSAFETAFSKAASSLPKEYKDQFKKVDYKNKTNDQKVKDAMRQGKGVEIVSKGVKNSAHGNINIGKALNSDEGPKTVPTEIANQIKKARAEKNLTQEQLSKLAMEKLSVIKDFENAEGVYDPNICFKIEKALGAKFTRSWKNK